MGMFDSDGTITGRVKAKDPRIRVAVANKERAILDQIQEVYGGQVYKSQSQTTNYM